MTKLSGSGGMRVQAQSLIRALSPAVELIVVDEAGGFAVDHAILDRCDYVIRQGWRQDIYQTFRSADFRFHTSKDIARNILLINFDATMLAPSRIDEINSSFEHVWCDSKFSRDRACLAGIDSSRLTLVVPPAFLWDTPGPHTQSTSYRFLLISNDLLLIKGVDLALRAFTEAFSAQDDVLLILKLSHKTPLNELVGSHQRALERAGRSHQIFVTRQLLSHDKMRELYASADCYVQVSRSETFGLPCLEAAYCGLSVIMHTWGGMADYAPLVSFLPVDGTCVSMPANIWRENSATTWFQPSISSIAEQMREAYLSSATQDRPRQLLADRFHPSVTLRGITRCLQLALS